MSTDLQIKVNAYTATAHYYRGFILNEFIDLEKRMEAFINTYIINGGDRTMEMYFIILDRMTLESKRQSLKAILDKFAVDNGFKKTKTNSYPDSKLMNELRYLIDERNKFAHFFLAPYSKDTDKVIGLISFRDELSGTNYSKSDIEKLTKRIREAVNQINLLFPKFRKDNK